ncbi:hypothetical protein D3C78_1450480 [compost metagenome]
MRCPDHHRFLIHHTDDRQFPHITHQFRSLLPGILAGNAGFDAKQWMGLVFTLKERGFAYSGFYVRLIASH